MPVSLRGRASKRIPDEIDAPGDVLADLEPAEKRLVDRAGRLSAVSDLLWIGQAALISYAAALFVFPEADTSGGMTQVFALVTGFILLAGVRYHLGLRAAKMSREVARAVKSRVRQTLLSAIAGTSPGAPIPSSGQVAAVLGEQVDALGPYLSNYYPQLIRVKIVPLGILAVTAAVSWLAALILLATGPIVPVFMALVGMKAKSASERQQQELTRMSGFLLDRVRGLETLRLFGALDETAREIGTVGDRFRTGTMRVLRIAFLSSTVLELFSALGIAFVAVYVGFSLLGDISMGTWSGPLTFGTGLFVLLLAPDYFAPLRAFAAAYHDRAAGLAAREKLQDLYSGLAGQVHPVNSALPTAPNNDAGRKPAERPSGTPAISFENVSVSLGGKTLFKEFSLDIAPGETVVLTGPSGAGKTTLIDCLLGLVKPDTGQITIEGVDLSGLDLSDWRQRVCWVGQAPRLFHGSLRANLLRANPAAARNELMRAIDLAGAAALVDSLPRGLDTLVGEDGFGFSVGESRRIALARAALRTSGGIILADEPTAGLDDRTAADVISGLQEMKAGRTLILATHDRKLMGIADQKVVLAGEHLQEVPA
jgi:ATP-binding cassette subfamily C protein CydD